MNSQIFSLQRVAYSGPLRPSYPSVSRNLNTQYARKPSPSSVRLRSPAVAASAAPDAQGTGLSPELKSAINQFITENKVIVFMKGTKQMPLCGFSNTVVQILNTLNAPFVTVNILEDELLRTGMKEYSAWPTFPQVYIDGEFYGGCDIMIASYQSGELQEALEAAVNS